MRTDYSKGLIKQVEELTTETESLKAKNKLLCAENRELRARISNFEASMEAKIEGAVAFAVQKATEPLYGELAEKDGKILKLEAEITRLKAQINKDSSNSSKPPSQNGFKKIVNSRERSGRKTGGQRGHIGTFMKLPEKLGELVDKGMARRETIDHTEGAKSFVTRYTLDIDVTLIVTEHRYKEGAVPRNHRTSVIYGDNIKALVCLLSNEGYLPMEKLSALIKEISHGAIKLSEATVEKFTADVSGRLDGEIEKIKADLLNGHVMHVDESPMDVTEKPDYSGPEPVLRTSEKTSYASYIRTHSNEQSTLYTVNPQKDIKGCERDGILPAFVNILSHDHEAKFHRYGTLNALCGEHLLRDLRGIFELQKIPWADDMRQFMSNMNKHKNNDLAAGRQECAPRSLSYFERGYDSLVADGRTALAALKEKELGQVELRRMVARLTDYKDCYLLFMRDYSVPFTNNLAERDLRHNKTKQKVSGCFRSWEGFKNFAKVRSFLSTVRKRSGNLFESILLVLGSVPVLE